MALPPRIIAALRARMARSSRLRRVVGGTLRRGRSLAARADRLRFRDEAAYLDHVVAEALRRAGVDR